MNSKHNNSSNVRSFILFLLFSTAVIAACENYKTADHSSKKSEDGTTSKNDFKSFELDPDNNKQQIDTTAKYLKTLKANPVTLSQINAGRAIFKTHYQDANPGLKMDDILIKMDLRMESIFRIHENDRDSGLVFHYGYSDQSKELCFILSLGSLNPDSTISDFKPFPADSYYQNDYYILLNDVSQNGTYKEIEIDSACTLIKNYNSSFDGRYRNINGPISAIPDHPLYIFHDGFGLREFHTTYYSNYTDLVRLRHIAGPVGAGNINYHVPVLISYNDPLNNSRFRNRGLDLGHLCPTKCNETLLDRCP